MNGVWSLVQWIYGYGIPADYIRIWNAAWW